MSEPTAQHQIGIIDIFLASVSDHYERQALLALKRSWTLDDKECQALALADAQVWATLHLARKLT